MSYTHRLPGARVFLAGAFVSALPARIADAPVARVLAAAQALRAHHPVAAGLLRRAALLFWWTCTLQIHRRLPQWLRARRLRRLAPAAAVPMLIETPRAGDLVIPASDQPVISVIIPTYGQTDFTLRCLGSIAAHPPAAPFEVIVVDDAWPGGDTACLAQVRGIRLQRNAQNLGFLRSCNAAAALARGDFVLFLNNDTQVMPGWADALAALLLARNDAGAAGSKLLCPDGRLQEAGGIIWNDGSGWNFGRLDDPAKAAYNYVREVDYCSGASLMVRRADFQRLGGFDERYAPAYFEDSDLSFRLRSIGLKTLYQPRSAVLHYEGASHGRDLDVGVKSYQVVNRRQFVARWSPDLARDHYPSGTHVLRARERGRHRPVVLVVDYQVPEPDRDAGSRTMVAIMQALLAEGMIVKFWPHNQLYKPGYVEALQDSGIEVLHGPQHPSFVTWLHAYGAELDLVLLSRPEVAEDCLATVRAHGRARIAYYGHDLHFGRMRMQGMLSRDERLLRSADCMEERERAIWRGVDLVLYPSDEEADSVRAMLPNVDAHAILPYCFDAFGDHRPPPRGREVLFVAGFAHPPNEDAACWLAEAAFPLIRARVPDAVLWIVGSNPTARVSALAGDAVRVAANVPDAGLQARYRAARVAAVPLRYGAGVKLKVVEALQEGVPLVTTQVGVQGLPGLGEIVAVHDDAAAFADAVCDALLDDAAWQRRSDAQLAYARARFTARALRQSLMQALQPLLGTPAGGDGASGQGHRVRAARAAGSAFGQGPLLRRDLL